jgi:hypothetical protein
MPKRLPLSFGDTSENDHQASEPGKYRNGREAVLLSAVVGTSPPAEGQRVMVGTTETG